MRQRLIFALRVALAVLIVFIIVLVLAYPAELAGAVKAATGGHTLQKEYDWYILPQPDGKPPLPNDQTGFIGNYGAYYIGDTKENTIFLTFDAGYENGYTEHILDILKKHQIPAAFFLVGHYIKMNPDLVKRMTDEGHLVCNHSMHHKDMAAIQDYNAFSAEMTALEDLYKDTTGKELSKFYRPPEGRFSELSLRYAKQLGYTTVFWSFAYVDWYNDKQPSRDQAIAKIMGRTHPGAVVLLHATSRTNADVLDEVLTKWKAMGYTFKSLNELKTVNGGDAS
jgi:peptidoglycan-N-acetylmuramic acid deacetylase